MICHQWSTKIKIEIIIPNLVFKLGIQTWYSNLVFKLGICRYTNRVPSQ